jgi:hypothetical protein
VFTLTYQVPASQAMLLGSLAALIGSRTPQGRPLTEPGSAPLATVIGQ